MNYLEKEIDTALATLELESIKLGTEELTALIVALTKKFFTSESTFLNPMELNDKSSEHNADFWKELPHRIHKKDLTLLVFDSQYIAWKIENAQSLGSILGETTGYPFWITDRELTFLVHMDDHDCVIWA
ncbi:MAG: hypothetical protein WBB95_08600 [Pseudomonas sp.]|uniref:hypothetical protein n=1 Tax=Pseudomonas sp. TaxID=306 RepID=UPI003C72E264